MMDYWTVLEVVFGLSVGLIVGTGIVTLVILAEVKKFVLWAKREVRLAKEELEWLRPWAEGVSRRIRRRNYDEGDFLGAQTADAQTQTFNWPGARENAGGIPREAGGSCCRQARGAGEIVPNPVATVRSLGEEGDYIDMSGVHALKDAGCGGMDRRKRTVQYEAKKERVVLPAQGFDHGEERVAQGARPKMGSGAIKHPAAMIVGKCKGSDPREDEVARFFREMQETIESMGTSSGEEP